MHANLINTRSKGCEFLLGWCVTGVEVDVVVWAEVIFQVCTELNHPVKLKQRFSTGNPRSQSVHNLSFGDCLLRFCDLFIICKDHIHVFPLL